MNGGGGAPAPPHRVCFFGTYARDYTVTRILRQACVAAGIEITECHRPLWEQTRHKNATYFGARSAVALTLRYARQALALARERRAVGPVSLYIIGFNGQLDALLLRLLTFPRHPPIVAAPLITLFETLVEDRGVFRPGSLRAHAVRLLDRASLALATHVVIDTEAHRRYLIDTLGLLPEGVSVWHLGADVEVFRRARLVEHDGPLRVVFYGTFLPLHGVMSVLQAAALLRDDASIEFELVGDGPEYTAARAFAREAELRRVHFGAWVPYDQLAQIVGAADICLGSFGTSRKAQMVIPNKVYQAAAVGRPLITADSPAVREVFVDSETAIFCRAGDAGALAAAIRTLANDRPLRRRIGEQAATMMAERFAPRVQGERLGRALASAMRHG